MQVILKSLCNIKDKNHTDGTGHIYFINNYPVHRKAYIHVLHYVNKKKYNKKVNHSIYTNATTKEKYISYTFTFTTNTIKPKLYNI